MSWKTHLIDIVKGAVSSYLIPFVVSLGVFLFSWVINLRIDLIFVGLVILGIGVSVGLYIWRKNKEMQVLLYNIKSLTSTKDALSEVVQKLRSSIDVGSVGLEKIPCEFCKIKGAVYSSICESLYTLVKEKYCCDESQVTLTELSKNYTGCYMEMIAFKGNSMRKNPKSFQEKIYLSIYRNLSDDDQRNIELSKRIFLNDITGITVFSNKREIKSNFRLDPNEREQNINQYIAVPITDKNDKNEEKVVLLLQIDAFREGCFGDTNKALEEFAEKFLFPYKPLMYALYEYEQIARSLV